MENSVIPFVEKYDTAIEHHKSLLVGGIYFQITAGIELFFVTR
jgi:hypothetical protein